MSILPHQTSWGHAGWFESSMLHTASRFLFGRYLGYDIKSYLTDGVVAYENEGLGKVGDFISNYQFPYPVASIAANALKNTVTVQYDYGTTISSEKIVFDEAGQKIEKIQTYFEEETSGLELLISRIHMCGGADSQNSIRALKSICVLVSAMKWLEADVHQNIETIQSMLSEDSVAFGAQGSDAILKVMKEGNDAGTSYSVPFPVLINTEATCVSLDFWAYSPELSGGISHRERGTDIMHMNIVDQKLVKIDTVRHTLRQPGWVREHFSM